MKAIEVAKKVINTEIRGLESVLELLDENFAASVELILQSTGRVIISGMGKSGLIGRKIAASLASTGTPSFYMHPGEAFHGDLGMIKRKIYLLLYLTQGKQMRCLNCFHSWRIIKIKSYQSQVVSTQH